MLFPPCARVVARLHTPAATAAAAGLVAVVLSGCVAPPQDLPVPATHAPSTQKTVAAAQHWDALAADVALQVADRLREWPPGEHPIQVVLAEGDSGFGRGFTQLVVTRLVERGIAVTTDKAPLQMQVFTQLVQHHAGALPVSQGPWVADGVRPDRVPAAWPTPDVAGGPLRTEVLVTTSLEREQRILVRTSGVVSIAQDDAALYQSRAPLPAPLPPPVMRTWRVVP